MTERIDARGEGVERWRADQWVTSAVAGSANGAGGSTRLAVAAVAGARSCEVRNRLARVYREEWHMT